MNNWQILYSPESSIDHIISGTGWRPIDKIDDITVPYAVDETYVCIWLESVFQLVDSGSFFGLSMDEVNLWEKTYINNVLISDHSDTGGTFDQPRSLTVPKGVLKDGENTIYIFLKSHKKWTLGISGPVVLQTESEFNNTASNYKIWYEYAPVALCVIIAGIVFSLLTKFVFNKEEKEHLLMAIRLIIILVFFVSLAFPFRVFSIDSAFALWIVLTPLLMITFFLYYQAIYNLYFTNQNRIMIIACFVLSFCGLLNSLVFADINLSPYIFTLSFVISIAYCCFVLFKMNKIKRNSFNLVYCLVELGGIVFIVVSLLLFLVAGLGGWNDPSEIMILSSAVLSANAIVYYARRDGIRKKALNELYKKYARQNPDKKQSISESAEDKLNTLMEFIQKNFAEALTRESLAEVIKMNPNYLSGLFNTYTGKSLSQYIAEIRINESLKMLRQSRRTIIDVAFSSGFYSLATFNRSFKQVMKMTPSEYKIQNT